MAEAPQPGCSAGERRPHVGGRERSAGGEDCRHQVFQPSNGVVTQSNEPPKNPVRFISTGDTGVERLCIRPATPHQKMTQRGHDMEIRVGSLVRDAREATGTAIIIDVFRAFTTAAIAFDHGAKDITLVAEVEEALALRERGIGDVLMGEVDGKHPEGFDYGNSPYEVSQVDFTGKSIVQSTRAGTVGVAAAANADTIYLGSLAVAQATVQAVVADGPPVVSIIAMGDRGRLRSDEDEHCALYLRNLLEGRQPDPDAVRTLVRAGGDTVKFFDESQPQYHPRDVDLALEISKYPFAMKVTREDGLPVARKYAV